MRRGLLGMPDVCRFGVRNQLSKTVGELVRLDTKPRRTISATTGQLADAYIAYAREIKSVH